MSDDKKLTLEFDDKVSISITPAMIEAVMTEWEAAHPGRNAREMTSKEFGDRMMEKIYASAELITKGNA